MTNDQNTKFQFIKDTGSFSKKLIKIGLIFIFVLTYLNSQNLVFAQNGTSQPQNKETSNKADQNLKSMARVNPSTLAMEMSLPLMTYPGRNGSSLPVGFNYSSKLWRMQATEPWWYMQNTQPAYVTDIIPMFAEKKAAGWTSNLVPPRIEEQVQVYDENGRPYRQAIDIPTLNQGWNNALSSFISNSVASHCLHCEWSNQVFVFNGYIIWCERWVTDPFCTINPGGGTGGGTGGGNPPVPLQLYYVRKFQVAMPDGANYEFRVSDTPVHCGNTGATSGCVIPPANDGTYLSVDGSGTKLIRDSNSTTLFMPNGSRYLFPPVISETYANELIDIDGNRLTFSTSTDPVNGQAINKWTDTVGRQITDPMFHNIDIQRQVPGEKTFSLPGLNGQPQNYSMTWQNLKPRGCEADNDPNCVGSNSTQGGGLEDQSQILFYETRYFCQGNTVFNLPIEEVLFPSDDDGLRPCNPFDIQRDRDGTPTYDNEGNVIPDAIRFNPVVLTEIVLPNGQKYEFKYNRYGEITKITYPAGNYETFEYDKITPIGSADSEAYDQTNRGVIKREVYRLKSDGNHLLEQRWLYSAEIDPGNNNLYRVRITAPKGDDADGEGMRTERFLFPSSTAGFNFGFDSPLGGMVAEERVYAENDYTNPRSRTVNEWTTKNTTINNNVVVGRDARIKRTVAVTIENGQALASLSETEFNETGVAGNNAQTDPEYFSHLNVKRTKGYHFSVIPVSTAKTGTLVQIAGYFNNNLLASVSETDYLYDPNYKAKGISSLLIETRVLNPQNTSEIIARTQTIYDNIVPPNASPNYPTDFTIQTYSNVGNTLNCPTGSQTTVCWQNPNGISGNITLTYRGKPTTSRLWDDDNDVWIATHTRYDQFGNAVKVKDAAGNEAETFFENTTAKPYFYAYPTKVITSAPDPTNTTGTSQTSNAETTYDFMTGLVLKVKNDFDQEVLTEYNDALLRPTRVSGVGNYVIPVTETIYDDIPPVIKDENGSVIGGDGDPVSVKVRKQIDLTNWDESETYSYDGIVKTRAKDSQGDVYVETEYDLLGRVKRTSNPYRLSDVAWDGTGKFWSHPRYDTLGRVFETCTSLSNSASNPGQSCPQGSSTGITEYDISTEAGFVGTVVTVTDASGRKSRSFTNGLGQLVRVDESSSTNTLNTISQTTPNPSPTPTPTPGGGGGGGCYGNLQEQCLTNGANDYPSVSTYYIYNPQGNLVKVIQGEQNRFFKYDSLGRLIRVRQPEQEVNTNLNLTDSITGNNQWTAAFAYDELGNLRRTTDANGVNVISEYDKAKRVIRRCYTKPQVQTTATSCVEVQASQISDTTAPVSFFYDGFMAQSQPPTASPNFAKGALTRVTSSVSETKYTQFDSFGRLTQSQQITDGTTYTSGYEYNFAGALIKETYPSGREVKIELEADGDLSRIYGKANSNAIEKTFANSFSYTPDGRIEKLRLGNGLWESAKFNNRLQVTEFNLGIGVNDASRWKLQYEYGELQSNGTVDTNKNTGNIARQTSSFAGLTNPFVQTFKYDSLYRLTEAVEKNGTTETWKQTFGYDRFGNRTAFTNIIGGQTQTNTNLTQPSIDANTNRINAQGYVFDKNGNLTTDPTNSGRTFIFNGENKQTEVKDSLGNQIGKYYYDGEGKRVKKEIYAGGQITEITVFVYSKGKLVAEYSTTPQSNPTTSYTMTDQLDSPRVITNATGEVTSRRDFKPFGEEVSAETSYRTAARKYGVNDNIRQKFTGYQKDNETQLDFAEARMYQNLHGRFTAVDPLLASGKSANPQTFNRFVYCLNNPVILTDPSGLQVGDTPGPIYTDGKKFANYKFTGSNTVEDTNYQRYEANDGYTYIVNKTGWKQLGNTKELNNLAENYAKMQLQNNPFGNVNEFPQGYINSQIEKELLQMNDDVRKFIYDNSFDYCKAQITVPFFPTFGLSMSKDWRLYGSGGFSYNRDINQFLEQIRNFNFLEGKPKSLGLKVQGSFSCGNIWGDPTMDERHKFLSGSDLSAGINLGTPWLNLGLVQPYPISNFNPATEFGIGPNTGVSFSNTEEIRFNNNKLNFGEWLIQNRRNYEPLK